MLRWRWRRARSTVTAAGPSDRRCSFCKKKEDAVNKLIAGPGVFICDDCVAVCVEILADDSRFERPRGRAPQGATGSPSPDAAECSLCGKPAPILDMLVIGRRGALCADCADAVEDALAQGRPAKRQRETLRMPDVAIQEGYLPGAIGRVAELHGTYYRAHWGFGAFFEAKVAAGLAEFIRRYDAQRDALWTATVDGRVEGAIAIDGLHAAEEGAHLRWFILSDALRGKGVGNRLMRLAVDFCRRHGYARVYLWTFEGLHAARHLYEKAGFALVEEFRGDQWGTEVTEQRFELSLPERS